MNFLNKKIFNFSNNAFGLDLSDLSIKAIQFEKKGTLDRIRSFGIVDIPQGVISNGEVIKKEIVISKIKELLQKTVPKKLNSTKVICSLPETKAFLRLINFPKMKEDEIKEAIKWEMEANIPLPLEQVYFDWQLLDKNFSKDKNGSSALIAAISKDTANQLLEILEAVGLDPIGLEIESMAQIHSLVKENNQEKTILIIDIGDRRTSFTILVGNVPCFTSSIPFSASLLTSSLSKALKISFSEAEKIKLNYGIGSFAKKDPVFKAINPALKNLVLEIEKSMKFYITELKYSASINQVIPCGSKSERALHRCNPSINQVILCGGGALTKGLAPYLSKKINKKIDLGNPWINLNLGNQLPPIAKDQSIKYSTAIGLALKGIAYENLP